MELKGNSIKVSTFLKYGLTVSEKSFIADVQLGSKYACVSKLHLTFFKRA